MPIIEQSDLNQEPRFFGALCLDIYLTSDIKFFNKDIETKQFIFKRDEKFDMATRVKSMLNMSTIS